MSIDKLKVWERIALFFCRAYYWCDYEGTGLITKYKILFGKTYILKQFKAPPPWG